MRGAGISRTWFPAVMLALVLVGGCSPGQRFPSDWNVNVTVNGREATVSVSVPGKVLGRDYHPHLSLDGGPEIMMYQPDFTFRNLPPGEHQVRVTLAAPDHRAIPGMEKTMSFRIPGSS